MDADMVVKTIMKTANVADLRNNFPKIAAWIADGESITIRKRGKPFATLTPASKSERPELSQVDFAGRLRQIWGERVFSDEEIADMRVSERDCQEG